MFNMLLQSLSLKLVDYQIICVCRGDEFSMSVLTNGIIGRSLNFSVDVKSRKVTVSD